MGRLLVLDFDGTMSDAEAEGAPYVDAYFADIASLVDRPVAEVLALVATFNAEIAADPQSYGWLFQGRIVAPAVVDPYLRTMPVARKIFDKYALYAGEPDRSRLLDLLYRYNYPKTRTAFRDGARDALLALQGSPVFIVTNSHTEAVQKKVVELGANADGTNALDWLKENVLGNAKKYVVDDALTAVPESLEIAGLSRPVLLRRRRYYETLQALLDKHGLGWSDLTVVGDIFELDLSLPLAMGARVGLVVNAFTPEYERKFVESHPRGRLISHLSEVPGFVNG